MPTLEDRIRAKNQESEINIFDSCNVQFTSVGEIRFLQVPESYRKSFRFYL